MVTNSRPASRRAAAHQSARRLTRQIVSSWRTQAIHAAVQIGVLDLLLAGPQRSAQLAEGLDCSADGLRRLLRALCALGICRERGDDCFVLAATGKLLCRENSDETTALNLRALAIWWGGPMWPMWGHLLYSVRTGASARTLLSGESGYSHLQNSPETAATFHAAMRAMTALIAGEIVGLTLWRDFASVVDVGGGHGELTVALLAAHPHLRGAVFDLSHAQAGAEALIADASLQQRCGFVAGSFFDEIPAHADCYLLKSILHNWNDERCAAILDQCRKAMRRESRMLLVERVRPARLRPTIHDEALARTDLNMLAGLGGRERSLDEFAALLRPAGLAVQRVYQTGFEFSVIEAGCA